MDHRTSTSRADSEGRPLAVGLENEVEMEVEKNAPVFHRLRNKAREGWAEASKVLAETGDDALVMGEFGNDDDAEIDGFAW
jgi:antitoxin MazE